MSSKTGSAKSFVNWLKSVNPSMAKKLSGYSVGSSGFDNAWKQLASSDPQGFRDVQHAYIKKSYYDPAVKKIESATGIDINKFSPALQNVIWSVATQHGTGGAVSLLRNAGVRIPMSEEAIIKAIYRERSKVSKYFSRSSKSVQQGVYNRFQRELQDALNMLAKYK